MSDSFLFYVLFHNGPRLIKTVTISSPSLYPYSVLQQKLKKYLVNKCVFSKLEMEFWIILAITLNSQLFSSAKTDSHLLMSFSHQFLPT